MAKNIIKENLHLLRKNIGNLFVFEAVYKLVAVAIVTPILVLMLDLAVKQAGFAYLADDNIKAVMASPLTILIIVVLLILGALYSLIEMSSLVINFHDTRLGQKLGPLHMLALGAKRAKPILHPKNFMLVIFVLIIIPMTGGIVASGFMSTIEIPEFIMDTIVTTPMLLWTFVALMTFFSITAIRWIFTIHCFVIEKKSFRECRKKSRFMVKGNFWKIVGLMVLWNILSILAFALVYGILIGVAALGIKILGGTTMGMAVFLSFFRVANLIMLCIAAAVGVPVNFALITSLYYRFQKEDEIEKDRIGIKTEKGSKHEKLLQYRKPIVSIALVVALVANGFIVYGFAKNENFGKVDVLDLPQITSHRGDSVSAPENTIPAFESAIENLADCAELDVHLTKDNVVVVMHDESLKRTAGLDKEIWEVDYDEIKKLDAGAWFGEKFKGTKVPTLDEVIKYCKGKIKLNIELKPSPHSAELEKETIKVINDNNFATQCVLTSLNYKSLAKAKKIDPNMSTGYILSVAYGDFYDMPYIDFFSVDAAFVTSEMEKQLHKRGKQLHVWTVDKEENMQKMVDMNVDCIITDDPVRAREIIYEKNTNSKLKNLLDLVFEN
ncbi:MAG: glycerophosphodiester phosphodiesterase [Anaerovoracaceae bacterium]